MAPRKNANALKAIDKNVPPPMTPRREEINNLKAQLEQRDQENQNLRSEMANLSSMLENVRIDAKPEVAPAPASASSFKIPAPVVAAPDLSLLDAKLPEAPARPTSAFVYFSNQTRKTLKDTHPNTKATEQSKIIGQMWKELSDEDRKPFDEMHEKDRTRYESQMKKYQAIADKVNIEKKALLKLYETRKQNAAMVWYEAALAKQPKMAAASTSEASKIEREAPKKPKTAFNIFCSERREELMKKNNGEKPDFGESMKLFSHEWAKLEATKVGKRKLAKYHDLAVKDKERYTDELEAHNASIAQDKATQHAEAARKLEQEKKLAVKTYASEIHAEAAAKEHRRVAMIEKKERKAQKELEPKRAKSAYIFFTMSAREAIASDMPGSSQTIIMEELGRRWREASPEDKKIFEDMASADKERYKNEMEVFKAQNA